MPAYPPMVAAIDPGADIMDGDDIITTMVEDTACLFALIRGVAYQTPGTTFLQLHDLSLP